MEWLWTGIAVVLAGGLTYLIAHFGASGKIGKYTDLIEGIKNDILALATVTLAAFKPDDDGEVRITPDEVTSIKDAIANLLERFGINLPI